MGNAAFQYAKDHDAYIASLTYVKNDKGEDIGSYKKQSYYQRQWDGKRTSYLTIIRWEGRAYIKYANGKHDVELNAATEQELVELIRKSATASRATRPSNIVSDCE